MWSTIINVNNKKTSENLKQEDSLLLYGLDTDSLLVGLFCVESCIFSLQAREIHIWNQETILMNTGYVHILGNEIFFLLIFYIILP